MSSNIKRLVVNGKVLSKFNDHYVLKYNNESAMSGFINESAHVEGNKLVFTSGATVLNDKLTLSSGSVSGNTLYL